MRYRACLLATFVVVSVVAAGCAAAPTKPPRDRSAAPSVASRDQPAHQACEPGTDATARTIDVYVAVLQHLTGRQGPLRPVQVLYVVDRAVPSTWLPRPARPGEQPRSTAPRSTSKAPFTAPVKQCLASVQFPNLPPIRLVSGIEDPRVAKKEDRGAMSVVADGRVIQLEGVPPKGDRIRLAASSNGGGGLDAFGGLLILERRGGSWRVVGTENAWIA
jgi:hypothetical protein